MKSIKLRGECELMSPQNGTVYKAEKWMFQYGEKLLTNG